MKKILFPIYYEIKSIRLADLREIFWSVMDYFFLTEPERISRNALRLIQTQNHMKDRCIRCGIETAYDETTHVDMRVGYIEGAGQLCINCYAVNEKNPNKDHLHHILVPVHVITLTPNDQELGIKIRKLYHENNS